jgi:hypothetical protein
MPQPQRKRYAAIERELLRRSVKFRPKPLLGDWQNIEPSCEFRKVSRVSRSTISRLC